MNIYASGYCVREHGYLHLWVIFIPKFPRSFETARSANLNLFLLKRRAQVQRQTPRSWDDYLKLLHLQIWAGSIEDRHCHAFSGTPYCHSGYERAAPSPQYIKIWGIGRITVEREKESWFDVFKNSHSFIASQVVIRLLIAGSGYDTENVMS